MSLQNAAPAAILFARYFNRPHCPECGNEQFVPELSSFVHERRVRHAWLCEACGHGFSTDIEVGSLAD
jgi:transcription elongation factor Elf1